MALKHTHTNRKTGAKESKKKIAHFVNFDMIVTTIIEMCYIFDSGFTEMATEEFKILTAKKIEERILENLMYKGMNFFYYYFDKSDMPPDEAMKAVKEKAEKLFPHLI